MLILHVTAKVKSETYSNISKIRIYLPQNTHLLFFLYNSPDNSKCCFFGYFIRNYFFSI